DVCSSDLACWCSAARCRCSPNSVSWCSSRPGATASIRGWRWPHSPGTSVRTSSSSPVCRSTGRRWRRCSPRLRCSSRSGSWWPGASGSGACSPSPRPPRSRCWVLRWPCGCRSSRSATIFPGPSPLSSRLSVFWPEPMSFPSPAGSASSVSSSLVEVAVSLSRSMPRRVSRSMPLRAVLTLVGVFALSCTQSTEPRDCRTDLTADSLGVATGAGLDSLDSADLDAYMSTVADSGAGWIRFDVDWSTIEPARGRFDWRGTDRVVAAADAHDLQVLGLLTHTPHWARTSEADPGDPHGMPADPDEFGRFAGDVADRYSDSVTHWEIWNE